MKDADLESFCRNGEIRVRRELVFSQDQSTINLRFLIRFFVARKNRASAMLSRLAPIIANASVVTGFDNYPKVSDAFKRKRKVQTRVLLHPETKSTNVIDRHEFVRRGCYEFRSSV